MCSALLLENIPSGYVSQMMWYFRGRGWRHSAVSLHSHRVKGCAVFGEAWALVHVYTCVGEIYRSKFHTLGSGRLTPTHPPTCPTATEKTWDM